MSNDTQGHRARLKDRYARVGMQGLSDHEALELLLCYAIPRKDVKPIAKELLNKFQNLHAVLHADLNDLQAVEGIGESSALLFQLIRDIFQQAQIETFGAKPCLATAQAAGEYCAQLLEDLKEEQFYILLLDVAHRLICALQINEGTPNAIQIHPRTIVKKALQHKASGVILTHNHPGGTPNPSISDIEATTQIRNALDTIEIPLLEHIIVADGVFFAMNLKKTYKSQPSYKKRSILHENINTGDIYALAETLHALDNAQLGMMNAFMQELSEN